MRISRMSIQQEFPTQLFGLQDSPAKTSRWREWARALGFAGTKAVSFIDLQKFWERGFRKSLSWKTSTGFSLATEDETSRSYSRRWMNSGMAWRGVCLTAKILESPN